MGEHELEGLVDGAVLLLGAEGYDTARSMWNARFDRHPDLAVRCTSAADVATTVRWARSNGKEISVKGGGHSYAGNTVADGSVLIDLSGLSGIKVHPEDRLARVEAGATWSQLDSATQHHGLATTGPTVSAVGVAGSILGGGTGWLSRRFGNALDNLVAIDVVTVDGAQVRASEDEEPELFWGMRGAGANLGIATSFEMRLHEVGPQVLAGQIVYPFDDAEGVLRAYRSFMAEAPDELQCLAFTFRAPPIDPFPERCHGEPVLDLVVFHLDPDAGDVVLPLRQLGEPLLDVVGPMSYVDVQQSFDPNLPSGQRYYTRAHDVGELGDEALDAFAAHVRTMQGALTAAYFEPKGGAVARVPDDGTALGGRGAAASFHIIAGWTDPAEDEEVMGWARRFSDAMALHGTGGVYVNLIAEDEAERVGTAFSDHDRVRALKAQWDPENRLRANHNVAPARSGAPTG